MRGDVAVEGRVPREQALAELHRAGAVADVVEDEAGDGERAAHQDAGDHPRDHRGAQVAAYEAAGERAADDRGHDGGYSMRPWYSKNFSSLATTRWISVRCEPSALLIPSHLPSTLW